jgi:hypothetical protein
VTQQNEQRRAHPAMLYLHDIPCRAPERRSRLTSSDTLIAATGALDGTTRRDIMGLLINLRFTTITATIVAARIVSLNVLLIWPTFMGG